MRLVAAVLQVAGLVALAVAGWMLTPWLGVAVGGFAAFAIGVALEPRRSS